MIELLPIAAIVIVAVALIVTYAVAPSIRATADNILQQRAWKMRAKRQDISRLIQSTGTTVELYGLEDEVIDFFEEYKNVPGVKSHAGALQAELENKRVALRQQKYAY